MPPRWFTEEFRRDMTRWARELLDEAERREPLFLSRFGETRRGPMKFRKKSNIVEAEQFFSDRIPWPAGVEGHTGKVCGASSCPPVTHAYIIEEGGIRVDLKDGDWIINDPRRDGYFAIGPTVFEAVYEPVPE